MIAPLDDYSGAEPMFALVSRLIYAEPTAEDLRAYAEAGLFDEAPFAMCDEAVARGLGLMGAWCASNVGSEGVDDEALSELRNDSFALFLGAGEPKAPSWASFYVDTNSQIFSKTTLEVRSLYREFGLEVEHLNREPDDNLGIMLGFIGHLMGLEAAGEDPEASCRAAKAQEEVLAGFVLPWIASWLYRVEKHARTDFNRGLGYLAFGLCRAYAVRFGVRYSQDTRAFAYRRTS